jgi:hypothetical protein
MTSETPGPAPLTTQHEADRKNMARRVADLAAGYGLTTSRTSGPRMRAVEVFGPHGLRVTVKFDGSLPAGPDGDVYVLSWHGVEDGVRLAPYVFGPRVNPFHGHKATDVARGFGMLAVLLDRRFEAIADGTAFITDTEGTS